MVPSGRGQVGRLRVSLTLIVAMLHFKGAQLPPALSEEKLDPAA